ncbi:MAG: hypothetical protein RL033_6587 [Pseudomonadota bacterium]|jgi:glutathione S-transferase
MALVLYHHPFSRAANVVWMLEEVGVPYSLHFVDLMAGAHKAKDVLALNAMGKLPILTDDSAVITESAAIGLYLADRYAPGRLAPKLDDPQRGTYLRWSLFAPSVVEPGLMAKAAGWTYKEGQAGWGNHESMIVALQGALASGDYLLGSQFSMADVILGGTVAFMLQFKMLDPLPQFTAYAERLRARPASQRAVARNAAVMEERGIKRS